MAVILIGGGARSGKSRYALEKARAIEGLRTFIATAEPGDEEMIARIERHRNARAADFTTIEAPIYLAQAIASVANGVMIVDCLTIWLSNLMHANQNIDVAMDALVEAAQSTPATIIFVTNEVGSGIIPTDHALSREFRDRAGILNQRVAAIAEELYFVVFGQPLRIK